MSDELADVSPIVGRSFVTKSNNVCTFQRIGTSGVFVRWTNKPSDKDMEEADAFVSSVLGAEPHSQYDGEVNKGALDRGREAYAEFLRRHKGE